MQKQSTNRKAKAGLKAVSLEAFFERNSPKTAIPLCWLWDAQSHGIETGKTLVLGPLIVRHFEERGELPFALIEDSLHRLTRGSSNGDRVRVNVSGTAQSPPFQREFIISRSVTSLKATLESIYRQWTSEEAEAFQIVNRLSKSEMLPIVSLQVVPKRMYQVCTREPSRGEPTGIQNYRDHNGNSLPWLRSPVLKLFQRLEKALKCPVEGVISFLDSPVLWEAAPETMSDKASLRCAAEMLQNGLINDLEFIKRVEPSMFAGEMFARLVGPNTITLNGLPVGWPTTVMASVRISPPDSILERGEDFILAVREASPEHLRCVIACKGILTTQGGITGHAALIARQMHIPAVVCSDLKLDYAGRRILLPDGKTLQDGVYALLDGVSGHVQLGESLTIEFPRKTVADTVEYREAVEAALTKVSHLDRFRSYPLELQNHIGSLRRALRVSEGGTT